MASDKLSVTDITRCDDCNGMYDPCNRHLARINELGVDQWEATGDITPESIPRDPRHYALTDHARHRMGSRHLNKRIVHHVIKNGEISRAPGENTFKFVGETGELSDKSGDCVVVVSVTKENLEKGVSNPIVTVYMEDEER